MALRQLWRWVKKALFRKRKPSRKRRPVKTTRKNKSSRTKKRAGFNARMHKRRAKLVRKKKPQKHLGPKKKAAVKAVLAGTITHYFPKVNAAVIKLKKPLHVGDPVLIKGQKTDFRQTVGSMQINRVAIESAKAGQEIGLEVFKEVRPGDLVYLNKG